MSDPTAVHHVLKNGSRAEIFAMLQKMVNLECTYDYGDTVYHVIMKNENLTEEDILAISQMFRNRNVNPNTRNKKVIAPLHLAIERRMIRVAEFFMRYRKPNIAKPNRHTFTLFFVEHESKKFWQQVDQNCKDVELWNSENIENESARFVEWLISRELDFDRINNKKQNSVNLAVFHNLHHISHILLGRATNLDWNQPAHALLQLFLYRINYAKQTYNHNENSKLWFSAYTSRYTAKIVKMLIDRGALNSYWKNNTQLAITQKEDISIIKMFFDHIPDDFVESDFVSILLNYLMNYPCIDLSASEIDSYLQILHLLLAKGADLNKRKELEMILVKEAVKAKNMHAVRWLDEVGTDFNVLDSDGKNLLHVLASEMRNKDKQLKAIFDLLVSRGCQVNAKDKDGMSPLHLAVKNENVALVKKLVESKAEINCRDVYMRSPLHFAVKNNKTTEIVQLLLKNGANVHAEDCQGMDALCLEISVLSGARLSMVKLLLEYGAEVNKLNDINNKTTTMNVADMMDWKIVEELLKYGLDINGSCFCRCVHDCNFLAANVLEKHCIKLKTAQLHCSEDYRLYSVIQSLIQSRGRDEYREKYYEECLKEIEIMKTTFIGSRTSLYDFLHMNLDSKFIHINNEKLKTLIDSPTLEEQFPQYSVLILASYRKAVARKSFLEPAKTAWLELTDISLPEICIRRILSYLNNTQLLKMIDVD